MSWLYSGKRNRPDYNASHIVINLQEIIAREVSAVKAAVVTIGYFHGGVAYNAIPSEVEIEERSGHWKSQ